MVAIDAYRQRYHVGSMWEYLQEPEWYVQEVEVLMAVEAEVSRKQSAGQSDAPEATDHADLVRLAAAQGFGIDPSWEPVSGD